MNASQPVAEIVPAYEALRAQATGEIPAITPRGLSLFLDAGLAAWMKAWTAHAPPRHTIPIRAETAVAVGPGIEVVKVLTEMALGRQRAVAI